MVCHVLVQLGQAHRPLDGQKEVRLFAKCRNERLRLPAFLRHYRGLGVARFFIVDNGSSDGTTAYLLEQPDVHVFRTDGSFQEARGGTAWINALLVDFGTGSWCLHVDVDELLIYPGSEQAPLRTLTDHLEKKGYEALPCMLLDMYPAGPLHQASYAPGEDLLAAAPCFDQGPYRRVPSPMCPGALILGGVRERVFYPEARQRDLRRLLQTAVADRLARRVPLTLRSSWVREHRTRFPPCLTKVPLVRWERDTRYLYVNHFVSPRKLAPETGVLLHFKFLQDFHDKASREAARGAYFDEASEYKRYAARLDRDPGLTLRYEGSARYNDSLQLVRLGLMHDSAAWRAARG